MECNKIEEKFNEMRKILGKQQCRLLDPIAVDFDRCIYHLLLRQLMLLAIAAILVFVPFGQLQILLVILTQSIYYVMKLVVIRAVPRTVAITGWISFCVTLLVCYYNLYNMIE